jgi:hypothetical protein
VGVEVTEQVVLKFELGADAFDGSIRGVRYFSLGGEQAMSGMAQSEDRLARRQKITEIEQRLGRNSMILSPQPLRPYDTSFPRAGDSRTHRASHVITPVPTPMEVDLAASWISSREDERSLTPGVTKTTGIFVRPEEVVFVVGGGD